MSSKCFHEWTICPIPTKPSRPQASFDPQCSWLSSAKWYQKPFFYWIYMLNRKDMTDIIGPWRVCEWAHLYFRSWTFKLWYIYIKVSLQIWCLAAAVWTFKSYHSLWWLTVFPGKRCVFCKCAVSLRFSLSGHKWCVFLIWSIMLVPFISRSVCIGPRNWRPHFRIPGKYVSHSKSYLCMLCVLARLGYSWGFLSLVSVLNTSQVSSPLKSLTTAVINDHCHSVIRWTLCTCINIFQVLKWSGLERTRTGSCTFLSLNIRCKPRAFQGWVSSLCSCAFPKYKGTFLVALLIFGQIFIFITALERRVCLLFW